jgi:hypothetical protein
VVLEKALEGEDDVGGEGEGGLALQLALHQLSLQLRVPVTRINSQIDGKTETEKRGPIPIYSSTILAQILSSTLLTLRQHFADFILAFEKLREI